MNKKKLLGQVRHLLSAVGFYLVASGKISEGGAQELIGLAMTLIGIGWSWFSPEKKEA